MVLSRRQPTGQDTAPATAAVSSIELWFSGADGITSKPAVQGSRSDICCFALGGQVGYRAAVPEQTATRLASPK
jgi:hypothetical protein